MAEAFPVIMHLLGFRVARLALCIRGTLAKGTLHMYPSFRVPTDNKTGQKGTNTMCVMTCEDIVHALATGKFDTYANPVVDFCPQKEGPYQIRITAGGNLITFKGNAFSANGRPGYGQDALEQCDKYEESKIHVSQHENLSHGKTQILQIHEDAPIFVPSVDR